jgi:hypothetical protein
MPGERRNARSFSMDKVIGLACTRRSTPMRRSAKPPSRNERSHEMPWRHLKVIEGERGDDLVTTLLRAIDMARSSRSTTTVYLLKMALLNEGIRLAADLAPDSIQDSPPNAAESFLASFSTRDLDP